MVSLAVGQYTQNKALPIIRQKILLAGYYILEISMTFAVSPVLNFNWFEFLFSIKHSQLKNWMKQP